MTRDEINNNGMEISPFKCYICRYDRYYDILVLFVSRIERKKFLLKLILIHHNSYTLIHFRSFQKIEQIPLI